MAESLATLLSPAAVVSEEWARRVRERNPSSTIDDAVFLAVADTLVTQLTEDGPMECPELTMLAVDDLTLLRQVAHERIASSDDPAVVSDHFARVDRAIDELLVDCVQGRIRHLELDAFADPLTGAGNRRALERDLRMFLAQVERYSHALSLVVIDVDGLKAVNDVQGHEAGDALLRQLATACIGELRAGDGFYRIGGDEFVAVLLHADSVAADAFVERVRPVAPAFSCGSATAPHDGLDVAGLLDVADQRLIQHRGPSRRRAAKARTAPAPVDTGASEQDVVLASVTVSMDSETTSIEVVLRQGGSERSGKRSGPGISSAEPRIAATATLEALERLGYDGVIAHIESAELLRVGAHDVVTVVVASRAGDVDVVGSGSAVVRRGVAEASARAVIQAIAPTLPARQVIQV